MSWQAGSKEKEKAAKIKRMPEREGILRPTFAGAHQPAARDQCSENSAEPNRLLRRTVGRDESRYVESASPDGARGLMDMPFGHDFSRVPTHTVARANAQVNQASLGVRTPRDRAEQGADGMTRAVMRTAEPTIQAQFCTPYTSLTWGRMVRRQMISSFIPAITATFGAEVGGLWLSFLTRTPGASLARRVFSSPSSSIVQGFVNSATTAQRQEALVDKIEMALPGNCPTVPPNTWTNVPVSTLLNPAALNYPIDFNQVFEIPGNIAGGVSGSAAGPDTRQVSGNVAFRRTTDPSGNTTDVRVRTDFDFVVRDAVDFCPGGAGAGIEQILTVPLSRLEATGLAYDVPFEVSYKGPALEESLPASVVSSCWPSPSGGGRSSPAAAPSSGAGEGSH